MHCSRGIANPHHFTIRSFDDSIEEPVEKNYFLCNSALTNKLTSLQGAESPVPLELEVKKISKQRIKDE